MQSLESLEEQIRNSLQVFGDMNKQESAMKELRIHEIETQRGIEEKRMAFEMEREIRKREKLQQKEKDCKYMILDKLLSKSSLTQQEEDLKAKLYAKLF